MGTDLLTSAIGDGVPLVVLSPHLDDAVLSCGALMVHAASRAPVTVATFFTEAGSPPHTLSARRYLRQVGMGAAAELYRARRAEDRAALDRMGVRWIHFGLTDGLFRRKPGFPRVVARLASRALPELDHLYPTYRLHLCTGQISPGDTDTLRGIGELVQLLVSSERALLLAPSAVGRHVDHLLVRTAAEAANTPVIYYSDFPYNQRHALDAGFARRLALAPTMWDRELVAKDPFVRAYRTQVGALFPQGIPLVPEIYFLPGPMSADRIEA